MSSEELNYLTKANEGAQAALLDLYDDMIPLEIGKIKYQHPSILAALECKNGLIEELCREAGEFFPAGPAGDSEACERLIKYIEELSRSLSAVLGPMFYFVSRPGHEKAFGEVFAKRFTEELQTRMGALVYAGDALRKKGDAEARRK